MKAIVPILVSVLAVSAGAQEPKKTQAQLKKEAKIEEKEARKTALKRIPNGKVQEEELEQENGRLIYSYDIKVPGKSGIEEVNVDAKTGEIVSQSHENPADEKAEAKAENKPAKKP